MQRRNVLGTPDALATCIVDSAQPQDAVLVDARLYDVEPLAYKFMVNFANDNKLQIEWMGDAPL